VASKAIQKAKESGADVVMVDTAGRMQDNEPLMRSLAKLVTINSPDRVFFVGEALDLRKVNTKALVNALIR